MQQPPPAPYRDADPLLQVYLLGSVEFEAALALQRRLVYDVAGEPNAAALIVCEHPPLITVGRHGSWSHLQFSPQELRARCWRIRWVNRGGGCLLHLPGQYAIYPILNLNRLGLNLREYLDRLHQVLLAVLDDFRITGQTRPDQAGVWVGGRMIASLGVAVQDWVTYYGAALNVNPDLTPFKLVRNGSPEDGPMTSVARERRGPLRMSLVRQRILEHFAERFGFARTALFFHHPLIAKRAASDAFAAHF